MYRARLSSTAVLAFAALLCIVPSVVASPTSFVPEAPEPVSVLLMAAAAIGLLAIVRRRRR